MPKVAELTHDFLETIPIACALWDAEGNLLDCNRKLLHLYGLSHKSSGFGSERFFELAPECQNEGIPSREKFKGVFHEAMNTGYVRLEWMARTDAGEPLPLDATVVRVTAKNACRIMIYVQDLRPAKAYESELKDAEERIRIMLDSMSFSCTFFDADGTLLDCNQRVVDVFGCENRRDYLDNFFHKYSPKYQQDGVLSAERAKKVIREAFEKGEKTFLWDHLTASGKPFPAEITLRRVKWKDRYCVVGYVHNLSEVRDLQDDLTRIVSIVEGSPQFVLYINTDHVIKYMNPAVFDISGYTKEEFLVHGMGLILSAEDLRRLNEECLPAAIEHRNFSFEMNITRKNGEKRILNFSAFAAKLHSGEVGVGLTARDITDMVCMQRELIEAKEKAERAMQQEQYYNKAKSDFLGRMSHEMRTPMNAIINMADIAAGAEHQELYLRKIGDSARLLMGIINNILDMMKFENGTFDLAPKVFNFSEMLRRVTEKNRVFAEEKHQRFTVNLIGDLPHMAAADEERLEQALCNLLGNAVKFTPEHGAVEFSVRKLHEDDVMWELCFEVRDTGIGMSGEQQKRVWQAFEQGDNGISRRYGGTGLGLSITKGIVELMDGSIHVVSEPGKGSCFVCTIRVGKPASSPENTAASAPESAVQDSRDAPAGGPVNFAGKRVLLADDVEINREIILALLEDKGMLIDCAANGCEALDTFTGNSGVYDIVLMDLHMPVMDGFEAARRIRRSGIPGSDTVPIVAVTADTGGDVIAQCRKAGMDGHIGKPINPDALLETIIRYLPKQ
jgi:PAS domain S-box-containing protein